LMRWPKISLTKHNIVTYERRSKSFLLNFNLTDPELVAQAKLLCEQKIRDWIKKKQLRRTLPRLEASTRYRVLKAARGKCELCGISSKISEIDIDHIVPKNRADRYGYVIKDSVKIPVDDEKNLQALCFRCNRAKRDQDDTDFRKPRGKIIRDRSLPYNVDSESVRKLSGRELKEKLFEKLIDEHARLIDVDSLETVEARVAEMIETLIAIAEFDGKTEQEILNLIEKHRKEQGGFSSGMYGDENVA
jgi:5-methylcytosine-specific restriction endonuclease McrA